MNYKTFLALLAVVAMAGLAQAASAQESVVMDTPVIIITPEQTMAAELADLRIKEADPATGALNRFFIRLKIRELENKLNLQKAIN